MSDGPSPALPPHPCRTCGACCATFRVSFYFAEIEFHGGTVPSELIEAVTPFRVAMRGTTGPDPRCAALEGEVGTWTGCAIHPSRPTPCREFGASWEEGEANPRCDDARARHGLPPLTPQAWAPHRR